MLFYFFIILRYFTPFNTVKFTLYNFYRTWITIVFIINILKIVQENNPDVVFDDTTMPVVLYGSSISKDVYECAEKIESALGKDVPIINSVTNMKVNKIKALFEEV